MTSADDFSMQRVLTPTVAPFSVPLLEGLFDRLFRILSLRRLLERVAADRPLERFELEHVSGGEEMGIVDNLDERFDFGTLGHLLFAHGFRHFEWISVEGAWGRHDARVTARTGVKSQDGTGIGQDTQED